MKQNRRQFIQTTAASAALAAISPLAFSQEVARKARDLQSKPWIELSRSAYLHNASQISKMADGKLVIAVLKNNAYGLGEVEVGQILDKSPHLFGMAVVKDEAALKMRNGGITKPILLMGDFDRSLAKELIRKDITLSVFSKGSLEKLVTVSREAKRPVKVALYIDTGLGRMGIPYQQTEKIAQEIMDNQSLRIVQTFSTLTTPKDFATEQIKRFKDIIGRLNDIEINTGLKHLAPSYSLLDLPSAHMDVVRPGILLHGSFPQAKMKEAQTYPLQVPYRLKAPVIRLEKLKKGDTIGFSRFYKVEKDEWIATLPVGWADGYDSGAENGAKVLLGNMLYSVVNVNASHANISLGSKTEVAVGDVATLIGPERPEITPEGFAKLVDGHNYLQINYKESIQKEIYENF